MGEGQGNVAAGDVTVALVVAAGRRWEREEEEVLARPHVQSVIGEPSANPAMPTQK